jgi:hypothetical protein
MFWLAMVKAGSFHFTYSFAMAWPTSSADSLWSQQANLAIAAARSPASLPRCCVVLHLMSSYEACQHPSG